MNMKYRLISTHLLSALAMLTPVSTHAQTTEKLLAGLPIEMNVITFLILGALLLFSIILLLKYKSGFTSASMQLSDITTELEHARHRFTETSQTLEKTEFLTHADSPSSELTDFQTDQPEPIRV